MLTKLDKLINLGHPHLMAEMKRMSAATTASYTYCWMHTYMALVLLLLQISPSVTG